MKVPCECSGRVIFHFSMVEGCFSETLMELQAKKLGKKKVGSCFNEYELL
jgi:hypothetical protein